MRIMVDTNVIMDILQRREPFFTDSYQAVHSIIKEDGECMLSASAATDKMCIRDSRSPLVSVQRKDIPLARAYSILGYKKNAVFPAPLAAVTMAWMSSVSTRAVTWSLGPSHPRMSPCFSGRCSPLRQSSGSKGMWA